MCGIAGIVAANELQPGDGGRALAMRDIQSHRGPDDSGIHHDRAAILAHRRLSIVDLATGQQPLSNEDATIWISFNGEIYNHADLRRDLERAGHVYRSRSDTETIVHAYEQWGDACVTRLRGMFAFAIWDARQRRLLLARDRLGIKPLYWARCGDRLVFSSEIKGILASGLIQAQANESAIPELLSTRSLAGTETMFAGISKLMPGHTLTFERGQVAIDQYWDIPVAREAAGPRRREDDVRRFRALLEESVRLRLMSDVPLGVFLSGGIDSSAIAALMARMIGRPLQTFSVAFKERAFNELGYARKVSQAIGADAHEIVIDDRDFFGALPRLVWHEDEPIAHPSSVPLFFVSALARANVKVVLTGEGSDELLAGYGKYPRALLNWRAGSVYSRVVPGAMRTSVAAAVERMPGRLGRYARRSFLGVEHAADRAFFDNFASINLSGQRRVLSPRLMDLVTPERAYGPSLAYFSSPPGSASMLDRILYADLKTYLVELLMKQDQMSMAASIESRVPFLDHHLVAFASTLPRDRKLSGFSTKRILREAVADVLPREILERPKMGFPVPFASWIRNGWGDVVREVLLDRRSLEREIVSPSAVEGLLSPSSAGTPGLASASDAVWSLFNLELWYRTFIDGEGVQTLPSPRTVPALNLEPETLNPGLHTH
jgi:asparagine synthase (glutamine-hydrolysing)